jgi:hypothetical protein
MAIFMKSLNEQQYIQKEKHYEAIKLEEYTKNRNWRSTITKQIRKAHYNRNDFIASAKAQHVLHQKLAEKAGKLTIMKHTPIKILALELDLFSPECERI